MRTGKILTKDASTRIYGQSMIFINFSCFSMIGRNSLRNRRASAEISNNMLYFYNSNTQFSIIGIIVKHRLIQIIPRNKIYSIHYMDAIKMR